MSILGAGPDTTIGEWDVGALDTGVIPRGYELECAMYLIATAEVIEDAAASEQMAAVSAALTGDAQAALGTLESWRGSVIDLADAALAVGLTFLDRGEPTPAAAALEASMACGGTDAGGAAGFYLGDLRRDRGDHLGAAEAYRTALQSSNTDAGPKSGVNLAVMYDDDGELDVLPAEVVNAADGWMAVRRAVGSGGVVVVEPVWQGGGAVG